MSFDRRAVVLVAYPNSDLKSYKLRPALVVQNNEARTELAQVLVALITTNPRRTGATRVRVEKASPAGIAMRLFADGVIVCDVIQTVATHAIRAEVGNCPVMPEVDLALRLTLNI